MPHVLTDTFANDGVRIDGTKFSKLLGEERVFQVTTFIGLMGSRGIRNFIFVSSFRLAFRVCLCGGEWPGEFRFRSVLLLAFEN